MNLRELIRDALVGVADRVVFHRDGNVTARRDYFYRHGTTAEGFAATVGAALTRAGLTVAEIEPEDRWAPWPRDSYFSVKFTVKEGEK